MFSVRSKRSCAWSCWNQKLYVATKEVYSLSSVKVYWSITCADFSYHRKCPALSLVLTAQLHAQSRGACKPPKNSFQEICASVLYEKLCFGDQWLNSKLWVKYNKSNIKTNCWHGSVPLLNVDILKYFCNFHLPCYRTHGKTKGTIKSWQKQSKQCCGFVYQTAC